MLLGQLSIVSSVLSLLKSRSFPHCYKIGSAVLCVSFQFIGSRTLFSAFAFSEVSLCNNISYIVEFKAVVGSFAWP